MKMANEEVRGLIEKRRLKHYEVAKALGIHEATFCRWMRSEMSPERKAQVLKAIRGIKL